MGIIIERCMCLDIQHKPTDFDLEDLITLEPQPEMSWRQQVAGKSGNATCCGLDGRRYSEVFELVLLLFFATMVVMIMIIAALSLNTVTQLPVNTSIDSC